MRIIILKMLLASGASFLLWQMFRPLYQLFGRPINYAAIVGILAIAAVIMLITKKNSKRVAIVATYTFLGAIVGDITGMSLNTGPDWPLMAAAIGGLIGMVFGKSGKQAARESKHYSEPRQIPPYHDGQA